MCYLQKYVPFFFVLGWRCKRYGHRTGDKECPFFIKGNQKLEQFRVVSTAPPYQFTFFYALKNVY